MDIYKYINRYFVYPLYYFKNKDKRLERLRLLNKQQYLSKNELNTLQLNSVKSIVAYAYEHTDYYRRIMDERGIQPSDIQTLRDLEKIPPLTKHDIQTHGSSMISKDYAVDSLIQDASGGSTGEPTIFYKSLDYHQMRPADQLRHDQWSGWRLGDRIGLIWGAQRDLKATQSIKEFIISRYIARIWELDAFEMTSENMTQYVKTLESVQPPMILGYANALTQFAKFLLENHPEHKIRPKGVISSAETLTEEKRAIISKAFGCKVFNRYGSREVGLIASECEFHSGLHINADNLHVEIVKDGKNVEVGESGDILITDFNNKAMPLIRYKLGDVGSLSDHICACGRGLPLMNAVEGRSGDFFVAKNGSLVHGEYFTHLFYGVDDVVKFQMIQNEDLNIHLKVISKEQDLNSEYLKHFKTKVHEMLGEEIEMNIEFVSNIPPTASGKLLFTISKAAR